MSVADELRKLADLKAEGLLTDAEFEAQKSILFGAEPGVNSRAAEIKAADTVVAGDEGLGVAGKITAWALVIGAVIFGLATFSGKRESFSEKSVSSIKADDSVLVNSQGYGCELVSDFERAVKHRQNQEITAWAMMVNKPYCFSADNLPLNYVWTVLSVDGASAMITPEYTVANYEKFPDQRHMLEKSYWTLTDWLERP